MNRIGSFSREPKIKPIFPSALLLFALVLGAGFAFSLLFLNSQEKTAGSEIRLINISNTDFVDVIVGGINYGDVKRGQSTGYQHWQVAYRYASVQLKSGGKSYFLQVDDYVGEKPLGSGRFAYRIKLAENGLLQISVQGDEG